MKATPGLAWDAMRDYYESNKDDNLQNVGFETTTRDKFIKDFKDLYDEIQTNYMESGDGDLDRHKQAAILLCCTIKNKLFKYNGEVPEGELFVGCEQIGFLLCLSFMKDMLNKILKRIGENSIEKYIFPTAFSCDTEYFDIVTRDLYLQNHKDDGVYVLFLAHILYYIEYNTLKEINPSLIDKIKKYTKNQ